MEDDLEEEVERRKFQRPLIRSSNEVADLMHQVNETENMHWYRNAGKVCDTATDIYTNPTIPPCSSAVGQVYTADALGLSDSPQT
jgi:hypothetical protein